MNFKTLRDESFRNNLLAQAETYYEFSQRDLKDRPLILRGFDTTSNYYGINLQNFIVQFRKPVTINCIALREAIHLGQTIRKFSIVLYNGDKAIGEVQGTSVGRKRVLTFPTTTVTSFRVYLEDAQGNDNITAVAAYQINEKLIEK
jgi:alpha-L-fucosidase